MSSLSRIHNALAARFVPYLKLEPIPCVENSDPMVDVTDHGLCIDLSLSRLPSSTGDRLFLREPVCQKLVQAQALLDVHRPNTHLVLVYAYRSMAIQTERFEAQKQLLGFGDRTDPIAYERTHHFIAVPSVAGHPTGGAIDVALRDTTTGVDLDFGTPMHALEQTSYAFSPYISDEATLNRKLLRFIMTEVGFAPYDGEWWHYSYGDKEWAAYYDEPQAFYTQLYFDGKTFSLNT